MKKNPQKNIREKYALTSTEMLLALRIEKARKCTFDEAVSVIRAREESDRIAAEALSPKKRPRIGVTTGRTIHTGQMEKISKEHSKAFKWEMKLRGIKAERKLPEQISKAEREAYYADRKRERNFRDGQTSGEPKRGGKANRHSDIGRYTITSASRVSENARKRLAGVPHPF